MHIKLKDKVAELVDNPEAYIKTGKILVNDIKILDLNYIVKENDIIKVINSKKYVSRGAYKLLEAIKVFDMNFENKVVLDIGSSTGGFTQVSLENKAKKVYALDVGTNQLDFSLRRKDNVISLEKTNLKTITPEMFGDKIDIVVVDVSFISLRRVFDVLEKFNKIKIVALIKPQYEAFRDEVEDGGFVDESLHKKIINKIKEYAIAKEFKFINVTKSPIEGSKSKNKEYLSLFTKG